MSEPKTTATTASVADFLASVPDPQRRADATALATLFAEATGVEPVMWGPSIVGFGAYRYSYASGRTGEWPAVGFSPRARNLTIYISHDFDAFDGLIARLGPAHDEQGVHLHASLGPCRHRRPARSRPGGVRPQQRPHADQRVTAA